MTSSFKFFNWRKKLLRLHLH